MAQWVHRSFGTDVKVFVDTAPVMEKPLAEQAGLGWQGKHTNLVSREHGSWLFLGEIYTALELPPDTPEPGPLRLMPPLPRRLPDRRVPGALPARCAPLHLLPDDRAQGSDPRRPPPPDRQPHLWLRRLPGRLPLEQVREANARSGVPAARRTDGAAAGRAGALDDAGFRQVFSGTPIKRIGRDRFVRNVLTALGNSGDPAQISVVERLTADDSELVRDAARVGIAAAAGSNSRVSASEAPRKARAICSA